MKNYSVYLFEFPDHKFYVGITSNIKQRFYGHKRSEHSPNSKVTKAINYYGWDNVSKIILKTNCTKSEALCIELLIGRIMETVVNGYNTLIGPITNKNCSRLGARVSESTKQKQSAAMKGRKPHKNTINALKLKNSKKVIDIKNGYVFDSAVEAAICYGFNKSTLVDYLTGRRTNKTNLVYLGEV